MKLNPQVIGLALKRVQYKHHRAIESKLTGLGITLPQWHALLAISNNPESTSHKLAVLTFQTDQAFGTLANRMADKGLIIRSAGVGKAILHYLTPDGEAMLRESQQVVEQVMADALGPLTKSEQQQLYLLLNKLPEGSA